MAKILYVPWIELRKLMRDVLDMARLAQKAELKPLRHPAEATLPVVRTVTMPDGKKIHVVRDDVFNRAIKPGGKEAGRGEAK